MSFTCARSIHAAYSSSSTSCSESSSSSSLQRRFKGKLNKTARERAYGRQRPPVIARVKDKGCDVRC
ncbi:hypothetical protein KCU67_g49, partial [Aureobasidium melanogenum]